MGSSSNRGGGRAIKNPAWDRRQSGPEFLNGTSGAFETRVARIGLKGCSGGGNE